MTDPTAAELDAICARLTKAQREALVNLPHDGSYADEYTSPPWPNIHLRAELSGLGRMRPNTRFRHGFGLTPLGVATRKRLIERMNG